MYNLTLKKVIDINQREIEPIEAIEGDYNSRFIEFKIMAEGKPLDLTESQVRIYALPGNGKEIFNDLKIVDGKKGIAVLELTKNMLVKGTVNYMLKINTSDRGLLSSNVFKIIVKPNLMANTEAEKTDEFTALENALNTVGAINGTEVRSKENATNIEKLGNEVKKHKDTLDKNQEQIKTFQDLYDSVPKNVEIKPTGIEITGDNATTKTTPDGDLAYVVGNTVKKYPALKYITAVNITSSETVKVKLPKEFYARKDNLEWGVAVKGYYYNTVGNFFPFHVAVNGAGTEEEDGYIYCKVQAFFKIQNADNSNDVQERSLNVTLVAIA